MIRLPKNIEEAITQLEKLPSIGPKTASRLIFFLLKRASGLNDQLGSAILALHEGVKLCKTCYLYAEKETCEVCNDETRDKQKICIVEDSFDALAIDKSAEYNGTYHILQGVLSPINGIGPQEIKLPALFDRITNLSGNIELIIATNFSLEGEATALYIQRQFEHDNRVSITRIARGLPMGSAVEYVDEVTLAKAFEDRRTYN